MTIGKTDRLVGHRLTTIGKQFAVIQTWLDLFALLTVQLVRPFDLKSRISCC